MNTKKLWWHVAVCYADDEVDIVRTPDYEKAITFAESTWRGEMAEFAKTKESGVLDVVLFDGRGRVLWSANDEPRGLGKTGFFDHIQSPRLVSPDHGTVNVTALS